MLQRCEVDAGTCRRIHAQREQHLPPAWASPPNSTRPMHAVEDRLVPASPDIRAHMMAQRSNFWKSRARITAATLHLIVYCILPSLVESPLSILISFHVQQNNTKSLTQKRAPASAQNSPKRPLQTFRNRYIQNRRNKGTRRTPLLLAAHQFSPILRRAPVVLRIKVRSKSQGLCLVRKECDA